MESPYAAVISPTVIALIALNLALGLGLALPLARALGAAAGRPERPRRWVARLLGLYLAEGVALGMGMGIPVLNVLLAGAWGVMLSRWALPGAPSRPALRAALLLALYSSLPAASFLLVPLAVRLAGEGVLSVEAASRFGIPPAFPWPTNTILGFYGACAFGAPALKSLLTTASYRTSARLRARPAAGTL